MPSTPPRSPGWPPRGEGLAELAEDPTARDLELLADDRDQLMAERTRTANRLHADLIQCAPATRRAARPVAVRRP